MADVRKELMQWLGKRFQREETSRFVRDVLAERQKMQLGRTENRLSDAVPVIETD